MAVKPTTLTLRCYGVGFGDCFLLTFHYAGATADRHMLIDFGTMQKPPKPRKQLMTAIARDIAAVAGPRLHVLVATHRHADHINGFATNAKGNGPGDIIAGLEPQLVVQPWTERPEAPKNFKGDDKALTTAANDALRLSLTRMREVTAASLAQINHLPLAVRREIRFVGEDGLSNMSAVKNLARMGGKTQAAFVQYGSKLSLRTLLPGVKVSVLGPPTIKQKADVVKQNPINRQEYWHFARYWSLRAATSRLAAGAGELFPKAAVHAANAIPIENRWFVQRLKRMRGEQLLRIVRAMDDALNNTSVILLIQAGTKKLLFPGDAQWENWEHTLGKDAELLRDVDVYKVGHHGSLNATPKTLWEAFSKRSERSDDAKRLTTVMSTRSESKHGDRRDGTEVPRDKLIRALNQFSTLRSTQELEADGGLVMQLEFDLR